MSREQEVFKKTAAYLARRISLDDLNTWVMDREPWGEPPSPIDAPRQLVGAIELSYWEMDNGDRDEESVRKILTEELAQLAASTPRS